MSEVAITKEINLTQLGQELTALTGTTGIGLRMAWDGAEGWVKTSGPAVPSVDLSTVIKAHVAGPPPPAPPDPRQEALDRLNVSVKANRSTGPMGEILYDMALAQGIIKAD
jgi:hypothetical protein